jgi:hypothetical protein
MLLCNSKVLSLEVSNDWCSLNHFKRTVRVNDNIVVLQERIEQSFDLFETSLGMKVNICAMHFSNHKHYMYLEISGIP